MEPTPAFTPDPPASAHAQAPPSAAHSNLLGDASVWAAARRSYAEGCSTPVVAERHGLNERTVRRRAATEDWPALRRGRLGLPRSGAAAVFNGEPPTAEAEFERLPELAGFAEAHDYEVGQLLLMPTPERLSRFGFRRAAEAAARGAPTEALAWMRLVQATEKAAPGLDRAARPLAEADYLRAAYAATLREAYEERLLGEEEEGEGEEDAAAAPETKSWRPALSPSSEAGGLSRAKRDWGAGGASLRRTILSPRGAGCPVLKSHRRGARPQRPPCRRPRRRHPPSFAGGRRSVDVRVCPAFCVSGQGRRGVPDHRRDRTFPLGAGCRGVGPRRRRG